MPPKIEEIPEPPLKALHSKEGERKNPFALDNKKTIKRNPEEVYGAENVRKGLNKPQYIKGTPLDKLFLELEDKLNGDLDELTLDALRGRILDSYSGSDDGRYEVTEKLLGYLIQILVLANQEKHEDRNLIAISLHDIKTFSKLVNLIIIIGVYPALNTFKIGIPLAKRRLKEFSKTKKPVKVAVIPQNTSAKSYTSRFSKNERILTLIYDKLKAIFENGGDVKGLLIKGTGYSDFLTVAITLITCPYFHKEHKPKYSKEFTDFVIKLPGTYELFQTYSLLLSSQSPAFFKQFVLKQLQLLHYNAPDGLLTLIEFVLGLRDNEEVNVEKFDHVANVVLLKPKEVSTIDYFQDIGNQIFDLLVNINRPHVTSCVGHIVERLWLRNQLVATDFFIKRIWQNLDPTDKPKDINGVFTNEVELNNTINVLISLTKKVLIPELASYIFKPIVLSLWALFVFTKRQSKPNEVILNILVSYFVNVNDPRELDIIAKSLLFGGNNWEFQIGPNSLTQIVVNEEPLNVDKDKKLNDYLSNLDSGCECFIELLKNLDDGFVLKMFKILLERWLKLNGLDNLGEDNPFLILLDLRLIESIGNSFKEDIAKTPEDVLSIVNKFLEARQYDVTKIKKEIEIIDSDDNDSDDEDDFDQSVNSQAMPVLLELLSAIITEMGDFSLSTESRDKLKEVYSNLNRIPKDSSDPAVTENSKAIASLIDRIKFVLEGNKPHLSIKDLHTKTLQRAISSLNDPLVPIRAHGLYLLRQLIESNSDIISVDFVVDLHLVQLKDPEPFIYLNVIKGLESLIDLDQKKVVPLLVNIYCNVDGTHELDERLRIGEVLLRYIQVSNEVFGGELADLIANGTIAMITRHKDSSDDQDIRLRMSAMSLLGTCCRVNPLAIISHLTTILEGTISILQLETDEDSAVMRRSAIVLIHDLIMGTSNTDQVPFPDEYREKVIIALRYVLTTDNDLLTREQAQIVLDDIEELTKIAFET